MLMEKSHQLSDQCRKLVVEIIDEMIEVMKTLTKQKSLRKRTVAAENRKSRKRVRVENSMVAEVVCGYRI